MFTWAYFTRTNQSHPVVDGQTPIFKRTADLPKREVQASVGD